jgi:hypothetical protein
MNNKMKAVQITGKHAHRGSTAEKSVQMRTLDYILIRCHIYFQKKDATYTPK